MCRARISHCERRGEAARDLALRHPALHARRRKFELGTGVHRLPLPWRPGWRNLLAGRAMGGNRYDEKCP